VSERDPERDRRVDLNDDVTASAAGPAGPGPTGITLPVALLVTMMASAYQVFAFAVLAAPLIDDLGLSRAQIGLVGSANTLVGALTSPATGRLTDRIGARRSVIAVIAIGAAGMAAMAVAPSVWWLAAAAVVGGVSQGWGNPATNHLIAARIPPGRRGAVTGVKQSGVTVGVFLSGATMPAIATAWGWRASVGVFAAVFAVLAVAVWVALPADPGRSDASDPATAATGGAERAPGPAAPLDPMIRRLAIYGLLMGCVGGAAGRFFPLFASESIGFSVETAGLLAGLAGLFGIAGRVVAGRLAERRIEATALLAGLSSVGVVYCVLLASVTPATRELLFLSPVLNAVGISAWNAVAMLAIITFVDRGQSGRASGFVMFGFLSGLTISAPVAGLVVDSVGSYRPVWSGAAVLAASAASLMAATTRAARRSRRSAMMS
jgi:predicted MFS family arabinose efflux permease